MAEGAWPREDVVRALYRTVLGREPESDWVVADQAAAHATPDALIGRFLGSDEARERQRAAAAARRMAALEHAAPAVPGALRVLLFGAYGNGNLGDAEQAGAVAALLRQAVRRPLDIRACSWIGAAAYPFDPAFTLPPEAIADPWALDGFDLLLIGGGGLFGTPHYPLLDAGWIRMLGRIGLPFGLVAVGGAPSLTGDPEHAAPWQALLQGAAFLSGRDDDTLGIMPGAAWLPDPVLLAGLRAGGGRPRQPGLGARPLLILKHPFHAVEGDFLAWAEAAGEGYDLVALEPRCEQALAARFPRLRFAGSFGELLALCGQASLVVSARYHGCIAALLAGVPCLGLGPGKILGLFRALGVPERFLAHCGELPARLAAPPASPSLAAFAALQRDGEDALARLAGLVEVLPSRRGR